MPAQAKGEPYISSQSETKDALDLFAKAGGFVLPKRLYVLSGEPVGLYLAAIVPVPDPEVFRYAITCTCDFARLERHRVLLSPPPSGTGSYRLEIEAQTLAGAPVGRAALDVIMVAADAGRDQSFEMLMVGDSLGHQSRFPNELSRLLARPGNPAMKFVGTHRPGGAIIPHEHYGGWRFISFYTVMNQDVKNYHTDRSPFVFPGPDGRGDFDVRRYLDGPLAGARPRNVHIQLGINDAFALDPDGPGNAKELSDILGHADILIAGIRKALPDAVITVGSVIEANATERAYIESYRAYPQFHSPWRWRKGQLALARRMVAHFENRAAERIHLVPTHMTVDPLDGYNAHVWVPEGVNYDLSNAVHPSAIGDRQLAGAIYAVVKAELAGMLAKP